MNKERPPHTGDTQNPFWFLGGRAQILVPGTATAGTLSAMEFTDPRGPRIEKWFAANSSPISDVNDAPAPFDIEAILASAEAYRLRVAGPPPTP